MKRHHWLLLLGLVALGIVIFAVLMFVTAHTATAPTKPDAQNLDDATLRVARDLYCPVCPNTPLDVCETAACVQWRALIREKLAAGETPASIEQYFIAQYGERVLGAPRPQGLNLTIYVAPVIAVLAGLAILFLVSRRWMRERRSPAQPEELAPDYRERIEHDLQELE